MTAGPRQAVAGVEKESGDVVILRRRGVPHGLLKLASHVLFVGSIVVLWQVASDRWVSSLVISSPVGVVDAARSWISQGYLQLHAWYTLQAVLVSFLAGSVLAFAVAVLFVELPWLGDFGEPYLIAFSVVPPVALIPIVVVWVGLGISVKIIIGTLATFFIVFVLSYQGLRNADANLMELSRILKATRWQRLVKFRIWAALPFFASGAKLALPKAALAVVVAEFFTGSRGLGYAILRAGNDLDIGGFFVGVIALTVVVYLLSTLLLIVERWALAWVPRERT